MRIGTLARQLGTTPHAIRFHEQRGLLPAPDRSGNGAYSHADAERLRLLIGLRQLDIPLEPAAELATMCAAGRCDEVSEDLRGAARREASGTVRGASRSCATSIAAWHTWPASSRPA